MREITIAYGMTETSPVSFQSSMDDPLERRVSTVGRMQPHLEVKIVDVEGRIVPRGDAGRTADARLFRDARILGRRGADPRGDRRLALDAYRRSGDLDEDGYCNIVGRIKDMVIRGGENIYPREVEEFLVPHPKIADVQVFGVPDERYGEQLCAWINASRKARR